MPNILFVDITPTHSAANLDLSGTINKLMDMGIHPSLLALKPALFKEHLNSDQLDVMQLHDREWRDMWVIAEGLNRELPIKVLNGIYRKFLLNSFKSRVAEEFESVLHHKRPDLVHCNNFNLRLAPVFLACRRERIPVVVHMRTPMPLGSAEKKLLQETKCILAVSRSLKEFLAGHSGFPTDKCTVWHNGIPFLKIASRLDPVQTRQQYGIGPEKKVVSILGRIAPYRGQEDFLAAMAPLMEERPEIVCLVAGRFAYREREFAESLQARYRSLVNEGRLRFILDRKDTEHFITASDIIVQPSRSSVASEGIVEGVSREVLLAMGLGVPVVTTQPEGSSGVLRDKVTALTTAIGKPETIYRAVVALLDNPGEASTMAMRAKKMALANHRSNYRTSQLLEIYEKQLGL